MNWFECKISYEKLTDDGIQKKVSESYLVDALSFTEAEARIIKEMKNSISGEFFVTDIKRSKIAELFLNANGDRYYKVKVQFIALDEKSGAEKKTAVIMLALASDIKEALAVVEEEMKRTMVDYVIVGIMETTIMDIFHFKVKD